MGADKANWYVSLFGNKNELKQLFAFLDSPNCRLVQFKEKNEGCYLTACRFSILTDPKKVCESAKKLVTMIRAFAKIELGGDFLSVNIGSGKLIVDSDNVASLIRSVDDRQDIWVFPLAATIIASANPAKVSGAEPSEPSEREKRLYDNYLNRCDEEIDGTIFDALLYFAQLTSWFSLYKVLKTIQSKIAKGTMIKDGWIDKHKLNDFLFSAQYYDAVGGAKDSYLGLGAGRHAPTEYQEELKKAIKRGKRPPNMIGLPEAENLIRNLLAKWLESEQAAT